LVDPDGGQPKHHGQVDVDGELSGDVELGTALDPGRRDEVGSNARTVTVGD
jgi:hypothetical protein